MISRSLIGIRIMTGSWPPSAVGTTAALVFHMLCRAPVLNDHLPLTM
jgi:hypothetical protein